MLRLHTLMLTNNRLTRVDAGFADMCPALESLILTNNKISKLEDVSRIAASCKSLLRLSLVGNLVSQLPNYRLYVIHLIPSLRVLDFQKVTTKEKQEAKRRFESAQGAQLLKDLKEREAAINMPEGGAVGKKRRTSDRTGAEDDEEVQRKIAEIEKRIEEATSMEEVARLQKMIDELQ